MDSPVELVLDLRAELAEGPWWDADDGQLVFVDILAGTVHRLTPETGRVTSLSLGRPVGAVVRRAAGGLAAALPDGIAAVDTTGTAHMICTIEDDRPANRLNDAKCDAAGRLWVGSMRPGVTGAGGLYVVAGDHSCRRVRSAVSVSNGIGWSPDGTVMYHVDSPTRRVDAYDYDLSGGTLSSRRTFVEFADGQGVPDGLTVDEDGHVWIAAFGGSGVNRFRPDGRLDGRVELPVRRVTSCAFGGPKLDELYITTAAIRRPEERAPAEPHAGGIFRCRPGVRGRLDFPYAG